MRNHHFEYSSDYCCSGIDTNYDNNEDWTRKFKSCFKLYFITNGEPSFSSKRRSCNYLIILFELNDYLNMGEINTVMLYQIRGSS